MWQRILRVRGLVITPQEDMHMWIKYANLCRKSGRYNSSLKVLTSLLQQDPSDSNKLIKGPPQVVYAYLKHMWASGTRDESFHIMKTFTSTLASRLEETLKSGNFADDVKSKESIAEQSHILARCYAKLGSWQNQIEETWNEVTP